MIADSPSQDRGVAHRPCTAWASSKTTPSGSEVISSACSPASRWWERSMSTAFGALRRISLSLRASGLTILSVSFPIGQERHGDEERYNPQKEPSAGSAGCWVLRGVEPEPALDRGPAQVAFLTTDDDHGQDEQPHQPQREQHQPRYAEPEGVRPEIGCQQGENDPTQDA